MFFRKYFFESTPYWWFTLWHYNDSVLLLQFIHTTLRLEKFIVYLARYWDIDNAITICWMYNMYRHNNTAWDKNYLTGLCKEKMGQKVPKRSWVYILQKSFLSDLSGIFMGSYFWLNWYFSISPKQPDPLKNLKLLWFRPLQTLKPKKYQKIKYLRNLSCAFQSWVLFSDSYALEVDFKAPIIAEAYLMFIYPWKRYMDSLRQYSLHWIILINFWIFLSIKSEVRQRKIRVFLSKFLPFKF